MTSRSNFPQLQINHIFLAGKHTQPREDLGVPLVTSPGHRPKARSWGQLFSMVPAGSAFQQGVLRNAWCEWEHRLVPWQPLTVANTFLSWRRKDSRADVCLRKGDWAVFWGNVCHAHRQLLHLGCRTRLARHSEGVSFPCPAGSWQSLPVQPWGTARDSGEPREFP